MNAIMAKIATIPVSGDGVDRVFVVFTHQFAVALNVGTEDRFQFAL
jgi:hypothetical protein